MISVGIASFSRLEKFVFSICLGLTLGLSGCGSPEERLDEFMERGAEYAEQGKHEEAIIEYKNVLQIDPNHAAAHEALSTSYIDVSKHREAYWEMSETVRLAPDNVEARLRYGTISATVGEHDLAREQAEAVLAIDPNRAQAYVLRGQVRLAREDVDGAESDFRQAIDKRPEGPAYRFLFANFLEQQGRRDEAIAVLREAVDLEPSYLAVSTLGRLVSATEDGSVEAERLLKRAIEVALEAPPEFAKRKNNDQDTIELLTPNVLYDDAVMGAYLLYASFLYTADRFDESIATLEEGNSKLEGSGLLYQIARLYAANGMQKEADELIVRATAESPNDPDAQLVLSSHLQARGDLYGALEAAQAAVAIDGESINALMREAELHVDIGFRDSDLEQVKRGRSVVELVLETAPSSPEAHFVKAKIELAEENPTAAERSLQTALEARPDWPQARFVLGSTLLMLGETSRARGELARVVELDPAFFQARRLLAQIHGELGEHEFAIEQSRAYLRQEPNDIDIRIVLGQSLIRVGRVEEAYEEVSKIPEENRTGPAYFALGRLDLAFGRTDLGRERILKANELTADNPAILRILLELDKKAGDITPSSKRIKEATESSPSNSQLAQLAAEVQLFEGDEDLAKSSLEWAVELDATNVSAQYALAEIERRAGNVEGMISVLEEAASTNAGSADLQYRLGLVYEQNGRDADSIAAYERAISVDPDMVSAKNNLAYLLAETGGDLDRALELAQQAKEQSPDDPNAADTLGWVLLKRGVPSAAIGYLEEALGRFPDQSVELRGIVGNHLAEAYEKNSESTKAVTASEQVIENFRKLTENAKQSGSELEEPEWAAEAQARIARLASAG